MVSLIAFLELEVADPQRSRVDVDDEGLDRDARLAHPAGDDRGVRGHPAVRRQDAACVDQPVNVVRRRLPADEEHVLPCAAPGLREVGVEDDRTRGGAGRRVQPRRDHVDVGAGVDHRVQKLVELARVDADDGLLAGDEPLARHLHRDAQSRLRRPLSRAGLEQVQGAALDRELDVLHLAVVLLHPLERLAQLRVGGRHDLLQALDRLRRADPGHDVLALRVQQELAVQASLTRRGVAREAHARRRGSPLLPNTIWTTLTAVPRSSGMSYVRR